MCFLPCTSPSEWRGVVGVCYYLVRLPLCGEVLQVCVITLYVSLCVARCCRCVLLPCMSPSEWRGVVGVCYYLVRLPLCGEVL